MPPKGQRRAAPAAARQASFGERVRAWWRGHPPPRPAPPRVRPKPGPAEAAPGADWPPAPDPNRPWPDLRRQLIQDVFGEGFVGPSRARVLALASRFALKEGAILLELGAGMGGGARAIAQELGAAVAAFERDADLVRAGVKQAALYDLEDRAGIKRFSSDNLDGLALGEGLYDGALIHDLLFTLPDEDKRALIEAVYPALRPGAALVVSDLFAGEGGEESGWAETERDSVHLCPVSALSEWLVDAGLELGETEEETEGYCLAVRHHWDEYVRAAAGGPLPQPLVTPLVREVERWARRVAAMQSGALRVWRLAATRPSGPAAIVGARH